MKIIYQLTEEQNKIAEAHCQSLVKCGDDYQWFGNMCAIAESNIPAVTASPRPALNWVDGFLEIVNIDNNNFHHDGVVEINFMQTMAKIGGYLSVDKMIFDGISRLKVHLTVD